MRPLFDIKSYNLKKCLRNCGGTLQDLKEKPSKVFKDYCDSFKFNMSSIQLLDFPYGQFRWNMVIV